MKKLFTLLLMVLAVSGLRAQDCAELYFSEYADGDGNNKYVEVFNPTNASVDLSNYAITRFRNGATLTAQGVCSDCWVTPLQGTVAAGDVFVVMNGQVEDVPVGGNVSPGVTPAMRAYADFFDCTTPYLPGATATPSDECYSGGAGLNGSFSYMNGDDAIGLLKKRPTTGATATLYLDNPVGSGIADDFDWDVIDLIGEIGYEPSTAWRSLPGTDGKYGTSGTWITARNTLIRKPAVKAGVTTNPNGFNALAQWDTLGRSLHYSLGWHVVETCSSLTTVGRTRPVEVADVSCYPNPVGTHSAYVLSTAHSPIVAVNVQDLQGRVVRRQSFDDRALRRRLTTEGMAPGVYLLQVQTEDHGAATLKLVVR